MSLKDRAKQLKTDIPAVFLALQRRETPWHAKLLAGLTVGYALSPIDLIPDFIPVLGYLDDLLVVPAGIALAVRLVPPSVMAECRARACEVFADGRPVSRAAAVAVAITWLAGFALVVIVLRRLFAE